MNVLNSRHQRNSRHVAVNFCRWIRVSVLFFLIPTPFRLNSPSRKKRRASGGPWSWRRLAQARATRWIRGSHVSNPAIVGKRVFFFPPFPLPRARTRIRTRRRPRAGREALCRQMSRAGVAPGGPCRSPCVLNRIWIGLKGCFWSRRSSSLQDHLFWGFESRGKDWVTSADEGFESRGKDWVMRVYKGLILSVYSKQGFLLFFLILI